MLVYTEVDDNNQNKQTKKQNKTKQNKTNQNKTTTKKATKTNKQTNKNGGGGQSPHIF